jgi:hypothetical protein
MMPAVKKVIIKEQLNWRSQGLGEPSLTRQPATPAFMLKDMIRVSQGSLLGLEITAWLAADGILLHPYLNEAP